MSEAADMLASSTAVVGVHPDDQVELITPTGNGDLLHVTHMELVEPVETYATTKEEEWVTKKKRELTTTRQIETRVQRQVVLEDGRVVEDSGPLVTTNTTEDTDTQEHEQTEHRKLGDDGQPNDSGDASPAPEALEGTGGDSNGDTGTVAVRGELATQGLVREVTERRVVSREEVEDVREMEDVRHLGDITDEQYLTAVNSGYEDIRIPLKELKKAVSKTPSGPRLVNESTKSRRVVDTEDTHEKQAVTPDGKLVSEKKRVTEHEDTREKDLSDEDAPDVDDVKEASQKHVKTKDEEVVEYIADGVVIGRVTRHHAETGESEKRADPGANPMDDPRDWESLSARVRKARAKAARARHRGIDEPDTPVGPPLDRKDALTKQPLDFDAEEETRKEETSKWLEHHFGSDSRSSKGSIDDEDPKPNTSYFNVTIKSKHKSTESLTVPEPVTPKTYVASVNTTSRVFSPIPNTETVNEKQYRGITTESTERYFNKPKSPEPEKYKYIEKQLSKGRLYGSHDELDNFNYKNGIDKELIQTNRFKTLEKDPVSRKDSYEERTLPRTKQLNKIEREIHEVHRDRFLPYVNKEVEVPTPPQRKRAHERKVKNVDDSRYDSGYRSQSRNEMSYRSRDSKDDIQVDLPPPDYSPPPRGLVKTITKEFTYNGYAKESPRDSPKSSPKASPVRTPRRSPRRSVSPSPPAQIKEKKIYQRTRFSADIPPPPQRQVQYVQHVTPSKQSTGSKIGQGIRKLVGKIRSASAERKAKLKAKRLSSRSPSPRHSGNSPTYHQFNVIDNIPPDLNHVGRNGSVVGVVAEKQVSSTSSRSRSADQNMSEIKSHRVRGASPVQRYYLGEDPFSGSIYGKENKYDGVKPVRTKRSYGDSGKPINGYVRGNGYNDNIRNLNSSTLGRFSKSTSRLLSNGDTVDYSRTAQTLPRKIHHESSISSNSYHQSNTRPSHSPPTRLSKNKQSNSTINVSIINTVSPPSSTLGINKPLMNGGPAKPARTYKSSLSRSKSFNVQPISNSEPPSLLSQSMHSSSLYKSNPHLNRLDESPIGLKSPGIVSSISRSQRDLNDAIIKEERQENKYTSRYSSRNGFDTTDKKSVFMKNLADRAPELYKTLHEKEEEEKRRIYSPTFTSTPMKNGTFKTIETSIKEERERYGSPLRQTNYSPKNAYSSPIAKVESNYTNGHGNHVVIRRGSNSSDNYSETYHITSKSDDPKRPSVTNTVKSFSKKTIPSQNGRKMETIESTETTTVTKSSRFGRNDPMTKYIENGSKYAVNGNGGVVIEVRNNNYRN